MVTLFSIKMEKEDLAFNYLHVKCPCDETVLNSCKLINKSFNVNWKIMFVMRLLGVGCSRINLFCSLMDICGGLSRDAYYGAQNISIALKVVFDRFIDVAAREEKRKKCWSRKHSQLTVTGDGSWAKRRHWSLLGVVTLIGKFNNKVLDVVTKSHICAACNIIGVKGKTLSSTKSGILHMKRTA